MPKTYSVELEKKIVDLYNSGVSPYKMVNEIPELQGKRPSVIYGILKKLHVTTKREITVTKQQCLGRRKYNVQDDYFSELNSESAYWLGFIFADGYILSNSTKIGIALSARDRDHLEEFKNCVKFTGEVHDYKQTNGYGKGEFYSRILITSQTMYDDLKMYGVTSTKSKDAKIPYISKDLIPDFIRGYLDGDGSITNGSLQKCGDKNWTIKFTGTETLLNQIQLFFGTNLKLESQKEAYGLTIGGNRQVEKILDTLYKNKKPCLKRKYLKYIEMKSNF